MSRISSAALAALLSALFAGRAGAQPSPPPGLGLSSVPTTKVLAIGRLPAGASPQAMKESTGRRIQFILHATD